MGLIVLDECVLQIASNPDASCHQSCLKALADAFGRCDRLVVSNEWYRRAYAKLQRLVSRKASSNALRTLRWLRRFMYEKELTHATPIAIDFAVPKEDVWLAELAEASGATILTCDAQLFNALKAADRPCHLICPSPRT